MGRLPSAGQGHVGSEPLLAGPRRAAGLASLQGARLRGGRLCLARDVHNLHYESGVFTPLRAVLLTPGDHYMHLANLTSYLDTDERLVKLYADADAWAPQAILHVVGSNPVWKPRWSVVLPEHTGERQGKGSNP